MSWYVLVGRVPVAVDANVCVDPTPNVGKVVGFAAVAPNANELNAPKAGAGAGAGTDAGGAANDGVGAVVDTPNANDDVVVGGAPKPPSGATFAVDGTAPANIPNKLNYYGRKLWRNSMHFVRVFVFYQSLEMIQRRK